MRWTKTTTISMSLAASQSLRSARAWTSRIRPVVATQRAMATTSHTMPIPEDEIRHAKYPHLLRLSELLTSYNNEDVASELLLLDTITKRKPNGLRCLVVTGGGDNYLSLLAHSAVSQVTAVDMSPLAQAVAELKLALAKSDLSKEEILAFLGSFDPQESSLTDMDRIKTYQDLLKPNMSADHAKVLETKIPFELQHGFHRFSVLDNANRHTNHLLNTKEGLSMQDVFEGNLSHDQKSNLKQVLGRPLYSTDEYMQVTELGDTLPPFMVEVIQPVLEQGGLTQTLLGHYELSGAQSSIARMTYLHSYTTDCHPDWMNDHVRQALKTTDATLQFVSSNFLELPTTNKSEEPLPKYDLVSPSNIFDWMPIAKCATLIDTVCQKHLCQTNGKFLLRRAFQQVPAIVESLQSATTSKVRVSTNISAQDLASVDQAPFFYNNVEGMACLEFVDQK